MAKKTTKRPPRQIWIAIDGVTGRYVAVGATKRATENSEAVSSSSSARVVGPYVLAERARER
jgi:hypothetical protein